MSSIVDRFQEPIFIVSLVIFGIVALIIRLLTDFGWTVTIILSGLTAGAAYILYQDYKEKQRLQAAEDAKEADLKRRIEHQVKVEKDTGKCISCTAEVPAGADKCPKCGYAVKHYTSVEN